MKKLSRPIALLLACMLMVSMCGSAWATSTEDVGNFEEYLQIRAEAIRQMILAEMEANALVESEVIIPSVPYTRVAGFKAPVTGTAPVATANTKAASTFSLSNDAGIMLLSDDDEGESGTDSGLKLSKSVKKNTGEGESGYTLTLEAYAIGSTIITEEKEDIPTDIILVLDQSGSMEDNFTVIVEENFTAFDSSVTNGELYQYRAGSGFDQKLMYKLEDGSYIEVNVQRTAVSFTSTRITNCKDAYESGNTYFYKASDGNYYVVTIERTNEYYDRNRRYTFSYVDANGNKQPIWSGKGGNNSNPNLTLYIPSFTDAKYQYSYVIKNEDGTFTQVVLEESSGENGGVKNTYYLYTPVTSTITKLNALKDAVKAFSQGVQEKANGADKQMGTNDDVKHRIAVVGFAGAEYWWENDYENTEVFKGSTEYGYGKDAQGVYATAFQEMWTQSGRDNVTASINALDHNGGTHPEWGLEMANGIFEKNPIPEGQKRNRVVIVFTDGTPGNSGFDSDVAEAAINQAGISKSTYGATVYTIGIFDNCDVNGTDEANTYMRNMASSGTGYYLAATNSNELTNIFEQIANKIESGGSSSTLGSEAVVRDIIAPSFTLPEGTVVGDITLSTYKYIGENQWQKNETALGATAKVSNGQVDVTGFNFSENWVGTVTEGSNTTYRGNKLVIQIPIEVKAGFLGGNNVPTNGANSGVYANANATTPIDTFKSPQVNVPIEDITVEAPPKNVYLLGDLTANDLKTGATVMCGSVEIDLSKAEQNYGLDSWQNEFVTIAPSFSTKNDASLSGLTDDLTYTVGCTITPDTELTGTGVAEKQSGSATGNIYVFKPVLTYADSVVEYLSTHSFPTYFEDTNYRGLVWKHGDTLSTSEGVKMTGTAPDLTKEYSYDETDDIDTAGKIIATADIPVNVTVKIDETDVSKYVNFIHVECEQNVQCGWDGKTDTKKFLLHVTNIVADLTITKTGLDVYAYAGDVDREMAIFTVNVTTKSGDETYTIALANGKSATIKDVRVGTEYTITEQDGWTWRYNGKVVTSTSEDLIAVGGTTVTIQNKDVNPYWLGGDNYAVNVFGTTSTGEAGTN